MEISANDKPGMPNQWAEWLDKWFKWFLFLGILVNLSGLLLPILEPDGALYATLAKNMAISNDFVNLKIAGADWLDKPHFPFWVTAVSFKIFGLNAFAYKLPALIFWLAGAYFIYAFAKKIYSAPVAQLAVLLYLSVEHLIISNNDVRAEPYLTGLLIASTYYYYLAYTAGKWLHYALGSFFLALAIMTKGIFIAPIIFSGFCADWIIKKRWKEFWNYKWWLSLLLVLLFIVPEMLCLYWQFDSHPEKTVFGKTQVSGIRFFFWDSQFGRFFNTGPIKGHGDPFFYFHTMLWAFLPWSLILVAWLVSKFSNRKLWFSPSLNYICGGTALGGFILFSLSGFQLPHYLNILYPYFAILVAGYLYQPAKERTRAIIRYCQNVLCVILFILCVAITIIFGLSPVWLIAGSLLVVSCVVYFGFPGTVLQNIIARSFCAVMIVNLFMNLLLYPALFQYQAGSNAAFFLNDRKNKEPVYVLFPAATSDYAFQFYCRQPVYTASKAELDTAMKKDWLVLTTPLTADSLQNQGYRVEEMASFPHFHITRLTGTFINQHSRQSTVDYYELAKVHRD